MLHQQPNCAYYSTVIIIQSDATSQGNIIKQHPQRNIIKQHPQRNIIKQHPQKMCNNIITVVLLLLLLLLLLLWVSTKLLQDLSSKNFADWGIDKS